MTASEMLLQQVRARVGADPVLGPRLAAEGSRPEPGQLYLQSANKSESDPAIVHIMHYLSPYERALLPKSDPDSWCDEEQADGTTRRVKCQIEAVTVTSVNEGQALSRSVRDAVREAKSRFVLEPLKLAETGKQ